LKRLEDVLFHTEKNKFIDMKLPMISTLAELPFYVSNYYQKPALIRRCVNEDFEDYSSREFFEQVRNLSLGLRALGVQSGDRVALIAESRPEWVISDLAILARGAVTVPVYPTLPAAQVHYILSDADISVVIVSDYVQVEKVRDVWPKLRALRTLIVFDRAKENISSSREVLFSDVSERGFQLLMTQHDVAREYKDDAMKIKPEQLATIIYTSGTTGTPKGVMLTHNAIVSNVISVDSVISLTKDDSALSFLPLSHALERAVIYLYLFKGVTIVFAESTNTVSRDLKNAKPTMMTGVPRVYEKLHAKILDTVSKASHVRRKIFAWALRVGHECSAVERVGKGPSLFMRLQRCLADFLVCSKIRNRMGGRLRFVVSGGAALSKVVAEFLFSLGVPVLEGYGLTETSPVLTANPQFAPRLGTVGKAIPGVKIKIAEDGEILARGPNIMSGYYGQPKATAEVIKDGWFHTGDIGRLDDDGYLTITDRKKELLVTSLGKNVAPQHIEQRLKMNSLVAEAILIGNDRPFITALIFPYWEALATYLPNFDCNDRLVSVNRVEARVQFQQVIDEVNSDLPPHEQIKNFSILSTDPSVETGELTPTLKVKRRVVEEKWLDVIDALYLKEQSR
jgi:long-chain acyl-CoA synthetase